jgi:hypothetical protein
MAPFYDYGRNAAFVEIASSRSAFAQRRSPPRSGIGAAVILVSVLVDCEDVPIAA